MQNTTHNRLPWILVTLLVALNITVLVVVWMRPSGAPHRHGPGHDGPPRGGLAGELGMSEAQSQRVEVMQKEHFQRLETFRDQIIALRLEAFAQFGTPQVDTAAAMAALSKIGAVQIAIEKDRYAHFYELHAICTEAEAKRLQEILPKILSRGNQPENRPKGPMPEGGPPPR